MSKAKGYLDPALVEYMTKVVSPRDGEGFTEAMSVYRVGDAYMPANVTTEKQAQDNSDDASMTIRNMNGAKLYMTISTDAWRALHEQGDNFLMATREGGLEKAQSVVERVMAMPLEQAMALGIRAYNDDGQIIKQSKEQQLKP